MWRITPARETISAATWKMAPAAIPKNSTADTAVKLNPPTHTPRIAGAPANIPKNVSCASLALDPESGATCLGR